MQATGLQGFDKHEVSIPEELRYLLEEGKERWLDGSEISALLRNHEYFALETRRLKSPQSGTIVFFDRGTFRKYKEDGYTWKKPETHTYLMVQKRKEISGYYTHLRDEPNFCRRSYWLIDEKKRQVKDIVLVHYRKIQEKTGREEISDPREDSTFQNHYQTLDDLDTREWDDLVCQNDSNHPTAPIGGDAFVGNQSNRTAVCGSRYDDGESGANHTGMEEIAGSGMNVQISDYYGLAHWTETPSDPIYSNDLTAPTRGKVLVENQSNQIAVRGSFDDGDSANGLWGSIVDDNDYDIDGRVLQSRVDGSYCPGIM